MVEQASTNSPRDVKPALAEWAHRQLEICKRAYEAGAIPALYDALLICEENRVAPPDWMFPALRDALERWFAEKPANIRGRLANPRKKYKMDLIHFLRWDKVTSIIEHHEGLWKEYQLALRNPKLTPAKKERLRRDPPRDLGTNQDDAFIFAAEELAGTSAGGSEDTMERSFKMVRKAAKKGSSRFYLVKYRTARRLGVGISGLFPPP